MKRRMLVTFLLFLMSLPAGCVSTGYRSGLYKPGPPAHAKAYGHRAKHRYRYHPEAAVYFDLDRRLYFHLVSGRWVTTVTLPSELRLRLGDGVTLEIETERPYERYDEHRRKYPPGQLKQKKNKGKNKYKNKW